VNSHRSKNWAPSRTHKRARPQPQGNRVKDLPPPRRPQHSRPVNPAQPQRLQKILSRAGISSRRNAEELIRAGRVRVNGQVVTQLGVKADPRRDRIAIDGRLLRVADQPVYILLHKPVGVVTTLSDPEGRPTVRDLLPEVRVRVFPVGRLDYHSAGLLLLTNDGELALRLTHPRYGVRKTYRAKVKGVPTPEALAQLAAGVRLEEGRTAPTDVRVERSEDGKTWLEITLGEGRNREVRRMCERIGHPVEKLRRVRIGPLTLGKLAPGRHRLLTEREIREVRRAVGLG
jgi:23S rRNA pseudouridine2605 synthase